MRIAFALLLAVCIGLVFLDMAESGPSWKKKSWRHRFFRPRNRPKVTNKIQGRLQKMRQCAIRCQSRCNETVVCKQTECNSTCSNVRSPNLCKKNCFINTCLTDSCLTCHKECKRGPSCQIDNCARICQGRVARQERGGWNWRCRKCLLDNCRPQVEEEQSDDDDEDEATEEWQEEVEVEEEEEEILDDLADFDLSQENGQEEDDEEDGDRSDLPNRDL